MSQAGLDWQHKGELFIAWWSRDTSGRQRRDREADLTVDTVAQTIRECETCAAIKQAKQLKPVQYEG